MSLEAAPSEIWDHCISVIRPALLLGPPDYLRNLRRRLADEGLQRAVRDRDSKALFDWVVRLLARQGISNHAAETVQDRQGSPTYLMISDLMAKGALCPRLRSYWSFSACRFRRDSATCGTPHHSVGCPVVAIPARKGTLAEGAFGLWLFVRDICDGDLVGWIDKRLACAELHGNCQDRDARERSAILDALIEIPGTGSKTWSMILSELLLGADAHRERWVRVGASIVAIDTLIHNFFTRSGILHRLGAEHVYGPDCYGAGGCASIIKRFAARIDAREFDADFPARFPRWVQFAIWSICAESGWSICSGNKINDREACQQRFCPAYAQCDKMVLKPYS